MNENDLPQLETRAAPHRSDDGLETAVALAHRFPRSIDKARERMKASCSSMAVAEQAFYIVRREGKTRVGPSVYLAREIATAWGNFDFGTFERWRDETRSEMVAYAIDCETMARSSSAIIVAHGGRSARELYENNAREVATRSREIILALLPAWYVNEAESLCYDMLAGDFVGHSDLSAASQGAILQALSAEAGVTAGAIEAAFRKALKAFTPFDWAQLRLRYRAISRGEIAVGELFPPIVAEEIGAELTKRAAVASARKKGKDDAPKDPVVTSAGTGKGPAVGERTAQPKSDSGAGPSVPAQVPPAAAATASGVGAEATQDGGNRVSMAGNGGVGDGTGAAKPSPASPPPPASIAAKASAQRQADKADEAQKANAKKAATPKPADKEGGTDAKPKTPAAPPATRLDKAGEPDVNEDPEQFILFWSKRLRDAPPEAKPLVEAMGRHVIKSLKDLPGLQKRWSNAVKARIDKLAALAKSASGSEEQPPEAA